VVFLVWTRYTDKLQAGALFPLVDLRLSNPEMFFWYFGDWQYRLTPGNWIKGGWRILNCLFGSFVLVGLAVVALCKPQPLRFPLCLLVGGGITTMVFSHLVLHHSHYYLMLSPAVALICASAFLWLKDTFPMNNRKEWIFTAMVGLLLGLSLVQGMIGMKIVQTFDPYFRKVASQVEKYTSASDKILIQGGGWGGDILIRTNRSGLSIWSTRVLEEPANLQKLKDLGYNKLVMISESPLLQAIQVTNPGDSERQRQLYQAHRTALVNNWPVLYQTEDVVIQEIP